MFASRSRSSCQSAESAPGGAARDQCFPGVPRGGLPQHHQLLGEESRGDAPRRVS
ncbi:hypothetical protein C0J52_28483 [Blattella germanica]|nr:hypothetical protein C0J52_28483 [Blattella germanica]